MFRPLTEPVIRFPWSAMWTGAPTEPVAEFLAAAREVGAQHGWLAGDQG